MKKIVFDIETAPPAQKSQAYLEAWEYCGKEDGTEGLFPEFSKVVCISALANTEPMRSFYGDEKEMLIEFAEWSRDCALWIGHNIRAFDVPFLQSRFMANGIPVPANLRTYGVKPWESNMHDTKELWKGGAFRTSQAASLIAVCLALGIPSPKDDISGKDVAAAFHRGEIERIVRYCEKDVERTAEVYIRLKNLML